MAEDQFHVCNNLNIPLPDFEAQFCKRCFNSECTRSLHGKTKFDIRTATWEDRLFKNPDRMDQSDPRFPAISAQRFLEIPTGAPLEIGRSAWVDPRNIEPEPEPPRPRPLRVLPVVTAPPEPAPTPAPEPVLEARPEPISEPAPVDEPVVQPQIKPAEPTKRTQVPRGPLQTPFEQGTMLSGTPQKTSENKDSWDVAVPPKVPEGGQPMRPGGKFRFGK